MILLKNGNIILVDKKEIYYGDVLIEENYIKQIGKNLSIEKGEVIDLNGKYVCPGFIDCSTQMGLVESGKRWEGNDAEETYTGIIAGMKTINGVYMFDSYFKEVLEVGVTNVIVNSGTSNVIGAQSSLISTDSNNISHMVIDESVDIKVNLGDSPKQWNYNSRLSPLSRMGIMDVLRKSFIKAKLNLFDINEKMNYEALEKVLKKEIPLKIRANKLQDIMSAVRLKNEFDLDIIIDECTEGYLVKDILKENNISIIMPSPLEDYSNLDVMNRKLDTAKNLLDYGINVSLSTHHPVISGDLLMFSASILNREGLDLFQTLSLITINPAKAFKIDDKYGSILEGKVANIIVFDELPTNTMSNIIYKIVNGKLV